jgi:hypothetical protein
MILERLIDYAKSVVLSPLTAPQAPQRLPILALACLGWIAVVSVTLFDIFLGLALYTELCLMWGYSDGFSLFCTALMYLTQATIIFFLIVMIARKNPEKDAKNTEYQLIKSILSGLIDGYRKK